MKKSKKQKLNSVLSTDNYGFLNISVYEKDNDLEDLNLSIRSPHSIYVTIKDITVYIDYSLDELYIHKFYKNNRYE